MHEGGLTTGHSISVTHLCADPLRMKRARRKVEHVSAPRSVLAMVPLEPEYQSDPEPREHPRLLPPVADRRARFLDFDHAGSSLTR
jgi:hypothetical protein